MSGYPTVIVDGLVQLAGSYDCAGTAVWYRDEIDRRLEEIDGLSPVAMKSSYRVAGDSVFLSATFRLVDAIAEPDVRATLLLYEDGVSGPSDPAGNTIWNGVIRKIHDQQIPFSGVGDEVEVSAAVAIESGWTVANLHGVGYVQSTVSREMLQGQMLGRPGPDFSLYCGKRVRSVTGGNGTGVFGVTLTNLAGGSDTFTFEPPAGFGDWTVDYLISGDDTPHVGPCEITLGPNQGSEISVRVHTDGSHEARGDSCRVRSATTGRVQAAHLRLFNDSPSILLVDNDGGLAWETSLRHALDADGYLYDWLDCSTSKTPTFAGMNGFDVVIWHGGLTTPLGPDRDAVNLMRYLDGGGALFLTASYYLNMPAQNWTFNRRYLGVASYVLDRNYTQLSGVDGDAIGDGLYLPLHFDHPSLARGDEVHPTETAAVCLLAPGGAQAMIRNTGPSGPRSVFLAERFDAISESDPNPNNTRVVLRRIVDWFRPFPSEVADPPSQGSTARIALQARPNPFTRDTQIVFELSPAAAEGPVRLEIFDPSGRRVARLLDGLLAPGFHARAWDGRAGGAGAACGVYFARLTTRLGGQSGRIVLLRR